MSVKVRPYNFATGTVINPTEVNANETSLYDLQDGNIDKDNIDTTSEIMITDVAKTISATHTYTAKPDLSADPLVNTDVDKTEIACLATINTFTAKQTFPTIEVTGEMTGLSAPQVGSLPAASAGNKGDMLFLTSDSKGYMSDGTAWNQINYVGGYTGGALRTYSREAIVTDSVSKTIVFKYDSGNVSVGVNLRGYRFPDYIYEEMIQHNHAVSVVGVSTAITDPGHSHTTTVPSHGHTGTFAGSSHSHSGPSHFHGINFFGGYAGGHTPTGTVQDTTIKIDPAGTPDDHGHPFVGDAVATHRHAVTGNSLTGGTGNTGGPSTAGSVANTTIGNLSSSAETTGITANTTLTGNTNNRGVTGFTLSSAAKTYVDSIQISLNGVDVTSIFTAATGWASIGDGTATHGLVTTGTGEVALGAGIVGMNTLTITEPTANKGGLVEVHIEVV